MRFLLKNARLSFPNLYKKSVAKGASPDSAAFSASFIIPPNHPQLPALREAIKQAAIEKFGAAKGAAMLKGFEAAGKTCLHNGDVKSEYDGFAGNLYVAARAYTRPSCFDTDGTDVDEASGVLYAGAFVDAALDITGYDNASKGVRAGLRGVKKRADGDAFSGSAPAKADEFDEIGAEGTEGPPSDEDLTA